MFQVDDYVVYGGYGICVVKAIGSLPISSANVDRVYYTLEPLYAKKNTIYTPVDNEKAAIRRAITEEAAWELIEKAPEIEIVWVLDEKKREQKYKEIMNQNECSGWIQIIKTLYLKKQKRIMEGKKNSARDDTCLKLAEDLLFGELAVALGMEREEVRVLIAKKVEETETE